MVGFFQPDETHVGILTEPLTTTDDVVNVRTGAGVIRVPIAADAFRSRGVAQGSEFPAGDEVVVECKRRNGVLEALTIRNVLTATRFTVASRRGRTARSRSGVDVDLSGLWQGQDASSIRPGQKIEALVWADPATGQVHAGRASVIS